MALVPAAIPLEDVAGRTSSRSAEDDFRLLYETAARPLRAYLYRMLNDISKADDILQETFLRFLQAKVPAEMTGEHRKNYLFRIATNLLHDEASRSKTLPLGDYPSPSDIGRELIERNDSQQSLQQLNERQREMLWLAYVERFSHKEIAKMVGVKAHSVRPMLARARENLGEILKKGGWTRS